MTNLELANPVRIGAALRALRLRAGLTPTALAGLLGHHRAGWVYAVEDGEKVPRLSSIRRWCEAVNARVCEVFGGEFEFDEARIGKRLRELRLQRGMSGYRLCHALRWRNEGHLYKLETGRRLPQDITPIAAICNVLGCSLLEVLS